MKRELTYHYANFMSQYGKKAFEAMAKSNCSCPLVARQNISSGYVYNLNYCPKKGGSHAQEIKKSKCRA
jgi:hypothetical protein